MKRIIVLFGLILILFSTNAQFTYYYYHSDKVFLNKNESIRYLS